MTLRLAGSCCGVLLFLAACTQAEPTPTSPPTATTRPTATFIPTATTRPTTTPTPYPREQGWYLIDQRTLSDYSIQLPPGWAVSVIGEASPLDIAVGQIFSPESLTLRRIAVGVVGANEGEYATDSSPYVRIQLKQQDPVAELWIVTRYSLSDSLGFVTDWILNERISQAKILFDRKALDTIEPVP